MKKLLAIFVLSSFTGYSQVASIQVVHNCADAIAAEVDVYVNGLLQLSDVPFRTASPFTDLPAGIALSVSIAPGDSSSVDDAFYTEVFNFSAGETYVIVADGIVSMTGYDPAPPFSLEVYDMARQAASNPGMIDLLLHHGSTDAPIVDVYETGQGLGLLADDFAYSDFEGYFELDVTDYVLQLNDQSGNGLAAFVAPLEAFGLEGDAVTIVASGFFDPSQNSNGPAFGLYLASLDGGPMVPLPPSPILGVTTGNPLDISVYPNPSTDSLFITGTEVNTVDFEILDATGRMVAEFTSEEINGSINTTSLPSGLYILNMRQGSRSNSIKFIKD